MMKSWAMLVVTISVLASAVITAWSAMLAVVLAGFSGRPHGPLTGLWIRYLLDIDLSMSAAVLDWLLTVTVVAVLVATPFLLHRKVVWSRWAAQIALAILFCALVLGSIAHVEDQTWRDVAFDVAYLLPPLIGIAALNLPSVRSVSRTA